MIYDIAIEFERLAGFTPVIRPLADGLRASTAAECPACAVIEYLNPNDPRVAKDVVLPGVATLGHLLHQAWAYQCFHGRYEYQVEAPIPWAHGVSHDDVVILDGPHAGVYECKTHSEKQPKAFSAANVRQSQFRLRLRELAGLPLGPMRGVMIGKAGREGGMVRGPWDVTLTDERRTEIDQVLAAIDEVMARADTVDLDTDEQLRDLAQGCTRCHPKPIVGASGGLDGLIGRYLYLKRMDTELDDERKTIVDARKPLKDELEQLRDVIDERVPDGVVVEAMGGTATRTRAGTLLIKEHPKAADAAA